MPRGPMTEEAKEKMRAKREAKKAASIVEPMPDAERNAAVYDIKPEDDGMNALAKRIFEGQSPNLPDRTRVERVLVGLKNQGYTDFSGLSLPIKDLKKYL